MNTGYSLLKRVKVHSYKVLVGKDGALVPYTLESVSVDAHEIGMTVFIVYKLF